MLMNSIELLKKSGHEIVLIGTSKEADEYTVKAIDFQQKAKELGIPFFNSLLINSKEIVKMLESVNADIAISINWKTIIGEEVIKNFQYGVLNAHMGDLPRYRGNACPNWAILKGEKELGISIHYMIPNELDAGNIVIKELYPIGKHTSITDIYAYIEKRIPELFAEAIIKIERNENESEEQSKDPNDILRCYPRIPSDSLIDWNDSSIKIERLVRASCSPFLGAYTYYNEYKIRVLQCRGEEYKTKVLVVPGQIVSIDRILNQIGVAAKDGVIIIEKAIVEGTEQNVTDIITSVRGRMNYVVQDKIYDLEKRMKVLERKIL